MMFDIQNRNNVQTIVSCNLVRLLYLGRLCGEAILRYSLLRGVLYLDSISDTLLQVICQTRGFPLAPESSVCYISNK